MASKLREFFASIKKADDTGRASNGSSDPADRDGDVHSGNPDVRPSGNVQPVPNGKHFEYAYAYWDKLRPIDLPKTGLGEALKAYETVKKHVAAQGHISDYFLAQSALKDVEDARTKAVSKCGLPHFKPIKKILEAVDPSVEAGVLNDVFRPKLNGRVDEMVKEAAQVYRQLENRINTTKPWIDAVKAGTATNDIKKSAYKLVTSESTSIVPGIDDIGEASIFRGKKAALAKDFPDMVQRFDNEVVAKLQEAVTKGNEYRAMLDDLDDYKGALAKDLGKS